MEEAIVEETAATVLLLIVAQNLALHILEISSPYFLFIVEGRAKGILAQP